MTYDEACEVMMKNRRIGEVKEREAYFDVRNELKLSWIRVINVSNVSKNFSFCAECVLKKIKTVVVIAGACGTANLFQ